MSRPSLVADKAFWIEYSEELEQQLAAVKQENQELLDDLHAEFGVGERG